MNVFKLSFLYFLKQIILVLGSERVVPLQHHIVQYPKRPHIRIYRTVVDFRYDLRGHVSRGPAKGVDCLVFWTPEREPEINKFELFVSIDENVFCLDVPVDDVPAVEVF